MLRHHHHGLRLPAFFAVLRHHVGVDAAAHVPLGGDAGEAWLGGFDDVVQDVVGDFFVEGAFVAEAPHVHLQALEFDAEFVGHYVDGEGGKVGLAGQRAMAGELGNLKLDDVVAMRAGVGEDVELFAGNGWRCGGFSALSCLRF